MKSRLLGEYQELMIRTRWIGAFGAAGLLFFVLGEIVGMIQAVANMEGPLSPEVRFWGLLVFICLGFLTVAILSRLFVLLVGHERKYLVHIASWFAVILPLLSFFLISAYPTSSFPQAPCEPQPGKICFQVYVLERTPPLMILAPIFVGGSLFRSIVTLIAAATRVKIKLK